MNENQSHMYACALKDGCCYSDPNHNRVLMSIRGRFLAVCTAQLSAADSSQLRAAGRKEKGVVLLPVCMSKEKGAAGQRLLSKGKLENHVEKYVM